MNVVVKFEFFNQIGQPYSADSSPQTADGFFANMSMVVFKIIDPIIMDYNKLLSRVSIDFCRYKHSYKDIAGREYILDFHDTAMAISGVDKSLNSIN